MNEFPDNKNDDVPTWTEIVENFFEDWDSEEGEHVDAIYEAAHASVEIAEDEMEDEFGDKEVEVIAKRSFLGLMEKRAKEAVEDMLKEAL